MSTKLPDGSIKPSDINVNGDFKGGFVNPAMAEAARWVVRYCQDRPGDTWAPFWLRSIRVYYSGQTGRRMENFDFAGLAREGLVIVEAGCVVTDEFVRRCHRAAPA